MVLRFLTCLKRFRFFGMVHVSHCVVEKCKAQTWVNMNSSISPGQDEPSPLCWCSH